MSDIKKQVVSIRLDIDEKIFLEKKAERHCMTLSQYIRHCALEQEEISEGFNNIKLPKNFTDEMFDRLMRMVLATYGRVTAIANQTLQKEDSERITKKTEVILEELNITKKENGSNTKEH